MNAIRNLLVIAGLGMTLTAQATLYTFSWGSGFDAGNGDVPDADLAGWSDTRTLSGITENIQNVNVRLNISGGYNGDLYGYLVHSSGFAVLLNRTGRTGTDPFGYANTGFDVVLSSQATDDIHTYQNASPVYNGNGQVTGIWQADGRNTDPLTVTDLSDRNAGLDSFNGTSANGDWTLFLADLSGGDMSTVVSWGLDIEVVPEPTTCALGIFGALAASAGLARRYFARKRA